MVNARDMADWCVQYDLFIWGMTRGCDMDDWHVWLDSFTCEHDALMWPDSFICDMTHLYVMGLIHICHEPFILLWRDMTNSYVTWLVDVICLIDMFDMTRSHVNDPLMWHDAFICVTWLIHTWHDSWMLYVLLICLTSLIHVWMRHVFLWYVGLFRQEIGLFWQNTDRL